DTEEVANRVYACYIDQLSRFNLHVNVQKTDRLARPFVTKKTIVINEASKVANEFIGRFLDDEDLHRLNPSAIKNPWRLTMSFVDAVKALCGKYNVPYDDVATYSIAVLTERLKKLVNIDPDVGIGEASREDAYRDAVIVLLESL